MAEWTVAELIEAAREADLDAYRELVERHEGYVWHVVRRYRLSDADAHDAVQETWLRLVENLDRLREPERLPGWLATTASREALRIIRSGRREVHDELELQQQPDQRFPSPEARALQQNLAGLVRAQVGSLPGRGQTLVLALSRPDPPSYAELAAVTGMPVGSIGPTRGRYLDRLRVRMEDCGLGADSWR